MKNSEVENVVTTQRSDQRGVLYAVLAALSMSIMALFVKLAAPNTTNAMTIMFRFGVSFLYIICVLGYHCFRGKKFPLRTHKVSLQIGRGFLAVVTMLLFYYSLRFISLVDGTVLIMTGPLFIPLLGVLFLAQKLSWRILSIIFVGFLGVLLILKPGVELFNVYSLYALGAGFTGALAIVQLKLIGKHDDPQTTMLYYFTIAFILSALLSIHYWVTPDMHTIFLLLIVGVSGTIYQMFLISASWHTSPIVVGSSLYMAVIFSGIIDWLVWRDVPSLVSIFGMLLIFVAAYFILKSGKSK